MIKYYITKLFNYLKLYFLLVKTLIEKECYFGPFVGEFGHLLSHIVPFITFLHSKGVKVNYCGPEIHKTFFYDKNGVLILNNFFVLRDFYNETSPYCNDQNYPVDIGVRINKFLNIAGKSKYTFWDIRDRFFYFYCFCRWQYHNNFTRINKFNKKINKNQFNVALFPSKKKNNSHSAYRGEDWDYNKVISTIENLVDKIYILGHPAFSLNINKSIKVEEVLTSDNSMILEKCLESDLIITQMSGAHYLGIYSQTDCAILLKGNNLDYSNLIKDSTYRKKLGEKFPLKVLSDYKSIQEYIKSLKE